MILKLNKRILLISAVICILILIPTSFASGDVNETLSTDNNIDDVVSDVGDTGTDNSTIYVSNGENEGQGTVDNPYSSISKAVESYNSSSNSKVYIKNGNYVFTQQIELDKDINIVGESKEGTVLDGNFQTSIFKVSGNYKITLTNLTFKNAKTGPALDCDFLTSLDIDNCNFENNSNGAFVFKPMYITNPTVTIKNSCFKDNENDDGAAIYMSRGTSLNITDTVFENNRAPLGETSASQGGAIYAFNNLQVLYVDNCIFRGNAAIKGSAISQDCAGDLYIYNSLFENNTSPGNSRYNINSSVVFDNQRNSNELTLYLRNNTLVDNSLNNEIVVTGNVKVVYDDKNVRMTASDVDKTFGDDFNYHVKLTDFDGNPLANKEIVVTLTNKYDNSITTISNITNANGTATISLKNQKAGKYSAAARFAGDEYWDDISVTNNIFIRTENEYNIIFDPDYIYITEGQSYNVTGFIYDEYLTPVNLLNKQYSIDWLDYDNKHLVIEGGLYKVDGNKIVFDVNRCHLVTRDEPYVLYFNVSSIGSGTVTVDLSKDVSNIDSSLDVIYVSKDGNDTIGDGSESNPLASVQLALVANNVFGGGKTIFVKEGVYEISTFTILGNVTIIGEKSRTVFKQNTGRWGMFELDSANIVRFINLTFIDGYATPIPESLIHVTDESIAYIDGCEFLNNSGYAGGAITVSRGGTVYINNSYFHENKAFLDTNIGGAIYVERGYLYIANSLFVNNTACDGGVIFLGFESEADIINSTFENNTAIKTTHSEGGGGAIFTRSNNLNIENCSFIENYADLYGGAIYIDYGDVSIEKSYFENNYVKYNGEEKGSAIESSYLSYCNLTMSNSVLISADSHLNYIVYIHNLDENHTVDLNDNLWKTNALRASPGVTYEVKINVYIENEFVYTGDIVEFTVELVRYNIENGTSPLNSSVHDLNLKIIPTIGNVENPFVTVKDNVATFIYHATNVGEEKIYFENVFNHTSHRFNVLDGSNKIKINSTVDIVADKTSTITVTLDANISKNLTIRVNDVDYSVKVNNSQAVLSIETVPGDYEVKVIFAGDETYKGFINVERFTVDKFESKLTAENITTYYNGVFRAYLKDDDGNPIANEKLTIVINGKTYTVMTDGSGVGTLKLDLQSTGVYNVTTAFDGSANYNPSQVNSTITVEYLNIRLTPEENVLITPLKGSFSVKVTDDKRNPIRDTEVIVTINLVDYIVKTDENGTATVNLANNGLNAAEYNAYVTVVANDVHSAAEITTKITVEKATATIKAEDIVAFAQNGELIVILTDEDGNPINATNVVVSLNGQTKVIKTDENGTASLPLNLNVGNYTAVISLDDNRIYKAHEITSSILVKDNRAIIYAPDVTVHYAKSLFTLTLSDVDGNPIANETLIVNINGNDYIAITDGSGAASVAVDLPIGSYDVLTIFEGNSIFRSGNATSRITVHSSISSSDMKRGYNSPYDFIATLKDENGNPVSNRQVTLVVNGKNYNINSDANGVVKLTAKLSVGKYAVSVTNPITAETTAFYTTIVKRIIGNANINMYYLANKYYKVRIFGDDGKAVGAGQIVKMTIGGKTYNVKTDKNGYASFKITLKPKTYTITATYKGVKVSNKVVVKPVLTAKNIVKKQAKIVKFSAKLLNTNGKAFKNKVVTFKIKGKTYKVKTDSKGFATLSLKNLKAGNYIVKTTYGKSTISNTVKIKK